MSARHWSEPYANAADLARQMGAIQPRWSVVTMGAAVLNGEHPTAGADQLHELADSVDAIADRMARNGKYEAYVVLTDGSAALRELAEQAEQGVTTGEFRAIRTTVAGGASVTEYVGEDTARYVAVDLGRSDQPPELVRVWAADPDDVDDDDKGVPT